MCVFLSCPSKLDLHHIDDVFLTLTSTSNADRVVRKLGEGTYGKVVKAVSQIDNKAYAVKIIRARQSYRDASTNEIRVLNELKKGDTDNEKSVSAPCAQSRIADSNLSSLCFQQMFAPDRVL